MEKLLLNSYEFAGTEPQGIFKEGQRVLASLMESQIWHRPDGSVALPTLLSGRKLSPSCCLDASHFSSSLYATGAFQADTLVLELRGSASD